MCVSQMMFLELPRQKDTTKQSRQHSRISLTLSSIRADVVKTTEDLESRVALNAI